MTEQEKQLLKKYPIHWREADCAEMRIQADTLLTDTFINSPTEEMQRAKESLYEEMWQSDNDGYLFWSYMKSDLIEQLIDAGVWDKQQALDFFTTDAAPV